MVQEEAVDQMGNKEDMQFLEGVNVARMLRFELFETLVPITTTLGSNISVRNDQVISTNNDQMDNSGSLNKLKMRSHSAFD